MLTSYQRAYNNRMVNAEMPIGYVLKRVQSVLRNVLDEALAARDLSMAQYAALSNLAREPELTNAELARRAFVTPQTMIRIVATLEDTGWISRAIDPANRRRQQYSLTPVGARRIQAADEIANNVDRQMTSGMSTGEIRTLRALLSRCLENLYKDPPPEQLD